MSHSKRKLPLVEPGQELSGKFPRDFERFARSAQPGSESHRPLVHAGATVARYSATACLPPTVRGPLLRAIGLAEALTANSASPAALRSARAELFDSARAIQSETVRTLSSVLDGLQPETPLDPHADATVFRYVELAAHYSITTALTAVDVALHPAAALEVPRTAAAALAYRNAGLGAARDPKLRAAAWDQAGWESEWLTPTSAHSRDALALQLFHEYLGVHWKNHVDARRMYIEQFLSWAFSGSP